MYKIFFSSLISLAPLRSLPLSFVEKKVAALNWKAAIRDVKNFLQPEERKFVKNWNQELFQGQLNKIELS